MDRLIRISVRDKHGNPLPDSAVKVFVDGAHYGDIPQTEGSGTILIDKPGRVEVEASYPGFAKKSVALADDANNYTFEFKTTGGYSPMTKDIGAAVVGLVIVVGLILGAFYLGFLAGLLPLAMGVILLIAALVLAFVFSQPTVLQAQLVRSTFALSAGALATQIPGLLNVSVNVGTQAAITAGGAIGVYVITFFFTPARDT